MSVVLKERERFQAFLYPNPARPSPEGHFCSPARAAQTQSRVTNEETPHEKKPKRQIRTKLPIAAMLITKMATGKSSFNSLSAAVVGGNLHAIAALQGLAAQADFKLYWASPQKGVFPEFEKHIHLLAPEQWASKISPDLDGTQEITPYVFFENYRHETLSQFLHTPIHSYSRALPLALRKKVESLYLWQDLTPTPLSPSGDINFNWVNQSAESMGDRRSGKTYLLNRSQILQQFSKDHCEVFRQRCLSVEEGDSPNTMKLIFEAPLASKQFDAIVWTSFNEQPQTEQTSQMKLNSISREPEMFWRSYTCECPEWTIHSLPKASIWIHPGEKGEAFRKTGCLDSESLFRVLHPSEGILQIDVLVSSADKQPQQAPSKPEWFLHKFCPFLENENLKWTQTVVDENLIFAKPFPLIHSIKTGLDYWSGGPFSNLSSSLEQKALWAQHPMHQANSPTVELPQ